MTDMDSMFSDAESFKEGLNNEPFLAISKNTPRIFAGETPAFPGKSYLFRASLISNF